MAKAILFGIAQKIIESLASPTFQEIGSLSTIHSVLQDAAEQQSHNHQIKNWLEKLNNTVYDAND